MVTSQKSKQNKDNLFREIDIWFKTMVYDRVSEVTLQDYNDFLNGNLDVEVLEDSLVLYRGDEQVAHLALWGDLKDAKKYEPVLEGSNT